MDTEAGAAGTPSQGLLSTAEAWTFQSFPSFQARGQPRFLCQILPFSQVTDSACCVVFLTQPRLPQSVCGPWVPVSPSLGTGEGKRQCASHSAGFQAPRGL